MNIAAEKALIMQRFNEVNDEGLIQAIKSLLDFGLSKQSGLEYDHELEIALSEAVEQSDNREVVPHSEVWAAIRKRYPAQ